MSITRRRALLGAALSITLLAAGCGGSDEPGAATATAGASEADVKAALEAGGELTVWAWDSTIEPVAAEFMKKYPGVKVKVVNAGTNKDEYLALQNAVQAGSGVPDVVQLEYYALPQFVLSKTAADLTAFGAGSLESAFTPGTWNAVRSGGKGVYGLPIDSGPMALFYNKEVFDKHGIAIPKTWEEYAAAAEKLHQADPKAYITADAGEAGFTTSLIWQAGGKPYTVNGTDVTVNLADAGSQRFTGVWQGMLDKKLLSPVVSWTDEWFKGLSDGTIASLVIGAWMPSNLESGAAAAKGKWRVAPMPQWESGGKAAAENGGSSLAITEAGTKKALAYGFLKYIAVDEGAQSRVDKGAFPATTKELNAAAFKGKEFPYFGGQKVNEVLAESAAQVVPGWNYLPFQVYANSIYGDTVGKAYLGQGNLTDGLKAWQDASVKYGQEQGFTVK
ncbi:ABC transporter substrate-binding protein [Actinoplanes utahensis]|uniref:Sugar ABC transporter substrate-binding protein n=1 Tax=Actinoplanes utahensis TaxID=1869 RepID=A0A0A6USL5_ACTUT|nr:sugar ABC transporter substrate-binding protein [Actinoplanes utahensis]KHD77978.1 sugar ABC transporter substrate-binding protein [Actinoplanes utahensis]GIF29956.1 sugar ABC transporter substrate-binding protein [Actinoplanes utahensis]